MFKTRFDDTGLEQLVGFYSRAFTGSQRKYAAYKVKLYAMVVAFNNFRMLLLSKKICLQTYRAAIRNHFQQDLPLITKVIR